MQPRKRGRYSAVHVLAMHVSFLPGVRYVALLWTIIDGHGLGRIVACSMYIGISSQIYICRICG